MRVRNGNQTVWKREELKEKMIAIVMCGSNEYDVMWQGIMGIEERRGTEKGWGLGSAKDKGKTKMS